MNYMASKCFQFSLKCFAEVIRIPETSDETFNAMMDW